jgi:hypothetical protein
MRNLVFALLVVAPIALIGLIIWKGQSTPDYGRALPMSGKEGKSPTSADPGQQDDALLLALLSGEPAGAKVDGSPALYDAKTLFDYINGAAPIFIERNFRKLAAAEMVTPEGGDLTCDVYDMGAADNAASIFAKERSAAATEVPDWPQAISGARAFVFHHDRYYVKLTAFDAGSEALLPELAAALRDKMK